MRKILHIDMDCFFAAVEQKHDPSLKGLPIAVGGRLESRGVVATCSYEARKFGVRSAMPMKKALQLCPNLTVVYPKFYLYKKESLAIQNIFKEYALLVEPLSLDEAFLDVTESEKFQGSATLLAQHIRERIFKELHLTASAGVASNKFLAKVCSDLNKPNGQFTLNPKDNFKFASQLPIEKFFGVGPKTKEKMHKLGVFYGKDLQQFTFLELTKHFGSFGPRLLSLSRGEDSRPVDPVRKRKSLSVENTFPQDLTTWKEIESATHDLYQDFVTRFKKSKIPLEKIKSVHVKVKYADFKVRTKEKQHKEKLPSQEFFIKLMEEHWKANPYPIRLSGLGVKLLDDLDANLLQLNLF